MNFYQFRIRHEEVKNVFFDWYHTQGTLVRNKDGMNKNFGSFGDPEELGISLKKRFSDELNSVIIK